MKLTSAITLFMCCCSADAQNIIVPAHNEFFEKIGTLTCTTNIETKLHSYGGEIVKRVGMFTYRKADKKVVLVESGLQGIHRYTLWDSGIVKQLAYSQSNEIKGVRAKKHVASEYKFDGMVLSDFLIVNLWKSGKRLLSLSEYYDGLDEKRSVRDGDVVFSDGTRRNCIVVELDFKRDDTTIFVKTWHRPDKSMLIGKQTTRFVQPSTPELVLETEILGFQDFNGITFPTLRKSCYYKEGKAVEQTVQTLTNIRINQPISDSVFQIPSFPPGIQCSDRINMTEYTMGTDWNPIGKSTPFEILRKHGTESNTAPIEIRQPSNTESTSWTYWLTVISGALFLLAICTYTIFWIRNKIQKTST